MSRRKRAQWGVSALPGVLKANARECDRFAAIQEQAAEQIGDAARRLRLARAYGHEADLCRDETLPLYWVTEQMAQVALDASHDLPVLSSTMAPTKSGFLAVAGGLPPLPPPSLQGWGTITGGQITEGISPSALLWETTTSHLRVTIYAHESMMPAGQRLASGPLQELISLSLPRDQAGVWETTNVGEHDVADAGQRLHGSYLAVMAWACATWHLMMMPTLAQRQTLDPRTGGEPATKGPRPEREVTHIDLRPLKQVTTDPTESTTPARERTHRWVVRGHWVQQPHGPGHSQRRLQWRESYIKGPAGAPLLRSRPVNVWRR
ncbi:hypothetical protein [Kocuria marina]|uniref:hypothetical protein n=1 Tax=Kocuria marina TaxID=223184 RepID=UPI0022E96CD1|nr:hypothetical protein [Kocuria marina]